MSEFRKEIVVGVMVAVMITAAIGFVSLSSITGQSHESSTQMTQRSTQTSISQSATFSTSSQTNLTNSRTNTLAPAPLYTLTFEQQGACNGSAIIEPWGVTIANSEIGNQTVTVPPGTPLSEIETTSQQSTVTTATTITITSASYSFVSSPTSTQTMINFSLPAGTYNYQVMGTFLFSHGTLILSDTNRTIMIAPATMCFA